MKYLLILSMFLIGCAEDVEKNYFTINDIPEGSIQEIIDPCGDGPGVDEVLLFLYDGTILAWYQDVGLAELSDGNYVTTDLQSCPFSISGGEYYD
jgi:hypothetical protein